MINQILIANIPLFPGFKPDIPIYFSHEGGSKRERERERERERVGQTDKKTDRQTKRQA